MKEIKFKAWDTEENEMVEWEDLKLLLVTELFCNQRYVNLQFTGLVDKNEKEIYTGDILNTWVDGYLQKILYVVEDMRKLYNEFNRDDGYYLMQRCEIIGNIYKNPELVKKKHCEHTYTIDCQPWAHRNIHTCKKCQYSVTEIIEPINED